jgi:tetratricopeptide (TPR) repeat protein
MQDEGKEPPEESQNEISGGVDIEAGRDVQVGGDIVGRDKVTVERGGILVGTVERLTHVNIPRAVQIGIVIAVLAIVALAALVAFQVFRPRGPAQMTGEFNVAVAQFGQVGADGEVQSSEDSQRLSQWLFERLEVEYESLSPELVVQVWHDSLDLGVTIGIVPGSTPQARAESAAELAQKINADMVIYGNLAVHEEPARFAPEFYVAELPEAEEIVGHHELGAPVSVQIPIDRLGTRLQVNQKLTARAKALSLFTIGLAWEVAGNPAKALEFFRQVEQIEDWKDNEGKEIVYLFIGREALFLWLDGEEREQEALSAFEKALALNSNYARAYVGLGNFYGQKAERLLDEMRSEPADQAIAMEFDQFITEAIGKYRRALETEPDSAEAQVQIKAHLALGGAYRAKGNASIIRTEYDAADSLLDTAIDETQTALSLIQEQDYRNLGQAYLGLGTVYQLKAHLQLVQGEEEGSKTLFTEALGAYTQCIEYADAQRYDWFLAKLKADYCTPYQESVQQALLGLQEELP